MVVVDEKYSFPRNIVGYGQKGLDCQWPNGARIAVNICINYELSFFFKGLGFSEEINITP
jgi:hypothetical protein